MFSSRPEDGGSVLSGQRILAILKLSGFFAVSPGAVSAIQRQLRGEAREGSAAAEAALRALATALARAQDENGGISGTLDEAAVSSCVAESTRGEDDTRAEALAIVPSHAWPRYMWDSARRNYICLGRGFPLHGPASGRVALFAERLALVSARLSRHPVFAPPVAGSLRRAHVPLTGVDALAGVQRASSGGAARVTVLGMLTQPEEGLWCLDDGQKCVALALGEAERSPGYFTEACVVLIEGFYDADATTAAPVADAAHGGGARPIPLVDGRLPGVLYVSKIAHPPPEARGLTLTAMGIVDSFGFIKTPAEYDRAKHLEKAAAAAALAAAAEAEAGDGAAARGAADGEAIDLTASSAAAGAAPFLFLSDVHLDRPRVLRALGDMLRRSVEAGALPALIVLMGNFSSVPFGQVEGDRDRARARFDALAAVLAGVPELAAAGTVVALVPGPNDPGTCGALPRPPIPAYFAARLLGGPAAGLPRVVLTSNPCRVRYFTQEIVVARVDVTARLRKRAILSPVPHDAEHAAHTLATLVAQAHLTPLPLAVQPVYWEHDYALRLLPLPDVLVLAEGGREPFAAEAAGMRLYCPAPFSRDTGFLYYSPALRDGQIDSRVDNDDDEQQPAGQTPGRRA